MRIGTNVLSMNARQSLYRMYVAMEHLVALTMFSQANQVPQMVSKLLQS
ncbi:Flagellin [Bacillus mycoides]|nr:Flagellin [Bacillus mycoides]